MNYELVLEYLLYCTVLCSSSNKAPFPNSYRRCTSSTVVATTIHPNNNAIVLYLYHPEYCSSTSIHCLLMKSLSLSLSMLVIARRPKHVIKPHHIIQ
jgi:hypothetical protein